MFQGNSPWGPGCQGINHTAASGSNPGLSRVLLWRMEAAVLPFTSPGVEVEGRDARKEGVGVRQGGEAGAQW